MSGQNGRAPAADEAARLEAAMARIARAAARHSVTARERVAVTAGAPLHETAGHAKSGAGGPDTAEIAARLDGLITELRTLLSGQDAE